MAHIVENRVRENATANGLAALQLQGAVSGRQRFREAERPGGGTAQSGDTFWYICVQDPLYEIGLGTLTLGTPDTLARTVVLESSNSDAAVSFNNASATVFSNIPAQHLLYTDPSGAIGDPTPFRATVIKQLIANLKAETGIDDNEFAFVGGLGTEDEDAGLFRAETGYGGAFDNIDVHQNDNVATTAHRRVGIKIAPTTRGISLASAGTRDLKIANTLGRKWWIEVHSEGSKAHQLSGLVVGDASAPDVLEIDQTGDLAFDVSGTTVRVRNDNASPLTIGYTIWSIS